ncbi:MAG: trigger factor [Gammaproteobacteria bacterium]|jgi:trigger factor|nr:trigger factor [Gammaproteobacteria bacterium]
MQVSLTATGGLERRLEVAVPATEVTSEVEQRLKNISRTARLKGFRPGKAPITVVRKQFGEQVHAEVIQDLMRSSFAQALSQEKLTPAGGPRIEPIAMGPGSELKYAAIFEVLPEIQVKPFETMPVERPSATVTEEDVDAMIESMRRQRPVFTAVERPAQDTDRVTIDFDGKVDGEPFEGGEGRDVPVVVGSRQSVAELEEGLKGATTGEIRTVSLSFPAESPNKQIAGKTAQLEVTIKKVEQQSLPEVDEEFCRAYGVEEGGIEALRTEVRKSMERELGDVIRNRVRGQVMDALYRENTFEVPRSMIDEQVQRLQVDAARRIGAKDASQVPAREVFEDQARRRAALGLLMGQIVQAQNIRVDRERVQTRLNDLVAQYPNPDEARRAYIQNADAMRQVESVVLEDQVVDWIVDHAHVTDKPMTFKDLTGFGQNVEQNSETHI